jgi:hypothetical protein
MCIVSRRCADRRREDVKPYFRLCHALPSMERPTEKAEKKTL